MFSETDTWIFVTVSEEKKNISELHKTDLHISYVKGERLTFQIYNNLQSIWNVND